VALTVTLEPPVCEFCGSYIREDDQPCPALDDGRCAPWVRELPRGPFTVPRLRRPPAATHRATRRWAGMRDDYPDHVEGSVGKRLSASHRSVVNVSLRAVVGEVV